MVALALLTTPGHSAVYEDQVGTRDWHHALIGTPTHTTVTATSSTAPSRLVVATNRNIVAVLSSRSSPQLIWRQRLDATDPILDLKVHGSAVLTLSGSAALSLRAWDLKSAFLLWEHHFPAASPPTLATARAQLGAVITATGSSVAAVLCPEWLTLLDIETGAEIWQKKFTTVPSRLWTFGNTLYLVGIHQTDLKNAQTQIDRVDLATGVTENVFAVGRPAQDVAVVTNHAHGTWVIFKTPKNHLAAQTLVSASSKPVALEHKTLSPTVLANAELISQESSSFVVATGSNRAWLVVVTWVNDAMAVKDVLPIHTSAKTLPVFSTLQKQPGSPLELAATLISPSEVQVRDLASPSTFALLGLPKHLASQGPIVRAQLVPAGNLAATSALITLQSGNIALLNSSAVIWSRAEALTDTVGMQWVDIPGSLEWSQESDELAEEPAVTQQRGSLALYLRRWRLHLQRLGHTLTTLGLDSLWSSAPVIGLAPSDPFDPATMALHEPYHTSAPGKMAVFLSSLGMITALNAAQGHPMWVTFLPQSVVSPTVDAVTFTHLFAVRPAVVRPPPLLAAVGQTASGSTVVYHINALTGEVVPMTPGSPIPLVLPFATHQAYQMPFEDPLSRSQVLALLAKDSLQLTLVPNSAETRAALISHATSLSLVISTADRASSNATAMPFAMAGFHPVPLADPHSIASARLAQNWMLQFPEPERLVLVTPRRGYESVASLGRVLGDRSVLYKFLNPHSLAVVTANDAVDSPTPGATTLGFYLVDAVSGAILYHAEHRHARYDPTVHPVHVVQCENWVVYQYWWEDTGAPIDAAHDKSTAKGRLDKYYQLAKEQGYRARSAFKLIQLNKKFNFLASSRCVVDLCAAPGGWLQVAKKYMPVSSLLIGIDLASIKPIPGVITFQEDITTEKCRVQLRTELKTWRADLFLHDGAPNVGTAWLQDAYSQTELTLMALKLAVEFLNKGGTFVTKVFRSKDYNNLLWVFNQLFTKVEATKPPSSRNVSAEIFVVCRGFIAPKKIDPRLLTPKYVFQDLDLTDESQTANFNILRPAKRQRNRDGYEEGNYTLHRKLDAYEFIDSKTPVNSLGTYNQITFDTPESQKLKELGATKPIIMDICQDLKLLGRMDFRNLLRWRIKVRKALNKDDDEEIASASTKPKTLASANAKEGDPKVGDGEQKEGEGEEEEEEEEDINEILAKATREEMKRVKRLRRKANEKRQKSVIRMQMGMETPGDIGLEQEGVGTRANSSQPLFNLRAVDATSALAKVRKGEMDVAQPEDSDSELDFHDAKTKEEILATQYGHDNSDASAVSGASDDDTLAELESQMSYHYEQFKQHQRDRDAKLQVEHNHLVDEEFVGFDERPKTSSDDSDNSDSDSMASEEKELDSDDSEAVLDASNTNTRDRHSKRKRTLITKLESDDDSDGDGTLAAGRPTKKLTKSAALWFNQPLFRDAGISDESDDAPDSAIDDQMETEFANGGKAVGDASDHSCPAVADETAIVSDAESSGSELDNQDDEKFARNKARALATVEAMTIAHQLVNQQKSLSSVIDEGFNRFTFNDADGLPECQRAMPVTKEAVRIVRERMKALDARPIKKIAEAKARKKRRAARRIEKLQKKANNIADNDDMTEGEKSKSINQLMAKKGKKDDQAPKLVVARGGNRGLQGRPKGVKGRYKMVDPRMKKELRAAKRRQKTKGRRK
ncbi:AdoMet-dependent rRNA methyltransferase spb1 [Dimargaris verticillata]|uniref:AdoMet-dependent rRNA methyltransferase spb1 n=1 Tax=Dimargaris verticillata TaxID=2761393 RepID=A0A9W8B5A5_9FUNG|nr:AdoMet-dependent rRNA methyltransferase spb1 [Dimargaris verticillata]